MTDYFKKNRSRHQIYTFSAATIIFTSKNFFYFFYNCLRANIIQASVVSSHARLVAVDAARSAGKVGLYGMGDVLIPSHKTGVWMGGSPNADHWRVNQGSQVHIAAVHAYHHL